MGCYGPEASDFTKGLLPIGTPVQLELDVQQRDRYGRMLAYVWLGETNANVEIAVQGYALQLTIPPNVKYTDNISEAVRIARDNGRGLWSACGDPGQVSADYEPTADDDAIPPPVPPPSDPSTPPAPPPVAPPPPAAAPPPPASKPQNVPATSGAKCDPSYPDFCIPPPPPDLNCTSPGIAGHTNFTVLPPDPHRFDADHDGVGCERRR